MAKDEAFRRAYWIPHQLILTEPRLEELIWDECLKEAHASGLIPIGPVMVRKATYDETQARLAQEHPFKKTEVALAGEVLYIAEVMVGASLG